VATVALGLGATHCYADEADAPSPDPGAERRTPAHPSVKENVVLDVVVPGEGGAGGAPIEIRDSPPEIM
jgi:hypothetical protein